MNALETKMAQRLLDHQSTLLSVQRQLYLEVAAATKPRTNAANGPHFAALEAAMNALEGWYSAFEKREFQCRIHTLNL